MVFCEFMQTMCWYVLTTNDVWKKTYQSSCVNIHSDQNIFRCGSYTFGLNVHFCHIKNMQIAHSYSRSNFVCKLTPTLFYQLKYTRHAIQQVSSLLNTCNPCTEPFNYTIHYQLFTFSLYLYECNVYASECNVSTCLRNI